MRPFIKKTPKRSFKIIIYFITHNYEWPLCLIFLTFLKIYFRKTRYPTRNKLIITRYMRRSGGGEEKGPRCPCKIQISLNLHYKVTKNIPQTPPPANSTNRRPPPSLKKILDPRMRYQPWIDHIYRITTCKKRKTQVACKSPIIPLRIYAIGRKWMLMQNEADINPHNVLRYG